MAEEKRTKPATHHTVAQDKAELQASSQRAGPPRQEGHAIAAPASWGEPVPRSPMLDRDRRRLAELRAMLPPQPRPRTLEEEREMHMLEEREAMAARVEWARQDARVLELQQNDNRTPEEDAELAQLIREIDQQDRAVKRAEGVNP